MSREEYLQAIARLKVVPPDYDSLAVVWWKYYFDEIYPQINDRYQTVGLPDEKLVKLVEVNVNEHKSSLSEEQYKSQLNKIHSLIIENEIKEIEKKIAEIPIGTHWSGDKPGTIAK